MLPNEIIEYIFKLSNNKCHTCNVVCKIPYKKQCKFYYCSINCYNFV